MRAAPLQNPRGHKIYAALCALLGWFGLAVQLYLIVYARWETQASVMGGLVKFFSFFTILTNILVAVALTCAAIQRHSAGHRFFRSPIVCGGITVSIVLVGIAYNLLLRHLWQPEGWQRVADEVLHDVMPLAFLLYWWLYIPKGSLRLTHVLMWMAYPVVYFAYVLLRGDLIGDYIYPFIDVGTIGFAQAFINALGVLAGFVAMGLVLWGVDKLRAPRPSQSL
jgi:hypothetical protein